jgi:hypothetical protein
VFCEKDQTPAAMQGFFYVNLAGFVAAIEEKSGDDFLTGFAFANL